MNRVFQTPFGITACLSAVHDYRTGHVASFKRLSASLHV